MKEIFNTIAILICIVIWVIGTKTMITFLIQGGSFFIFLPCIVFMSIVLFLLLFGFVRSL